MLCNKHFKEEDFLIRTGDNRKLLKTGSLPYNAKPNKNKERYVLYVTYIKLPYIFLRNKKNYICIYIFLFSILFFS